jgi:ArsR family transcriptional regulator, arsenate/arsenite/antimonite-responsive transcriptional repressor
MAAEKNLKYLESHIDLANFAKAMSHPARLYILEVLSKQSCCYSGDMAEEIPIARSTLSQHLKELKRSGLIQGSIESPKIKYCIEPENWKLAKKYFSEFFKS